MRSTSAAWTAATMTSPYDRAVKPSTTMAAALVLFRRDGGSAGTGRMQNFAQVLGELIAIRGVTSTPAMRLGSTGTT
jgi:hypothetical protein